MCFSPEISLITFIVGIIGAALSFSLGTTTDKIVGTIFGFISLMQGIEFGLWKHQNCDNINKTFTSLGLIFNHIQPIVLAAIILYFNKNLSSNEFSYKRNIIILLTIIYTAVIIFYSLQFQLQDECTIKNDYQHLQWNWNLLKYKGIVYTLFLITVIIIFLIGTPNFVQGIFIAIFLLVSYMISFFIYKERNIIGSMWCFFSALFPFFWFIIRKLNII